MQMDMLSQLARLATLNGRFTEGGLRTRGFTMEAIRRSINGGLFEHSVSGVLTSILPRLRPGKLRRMGLSEADITGNPDDMVPGATVQRVVDGQIKELQVVRMENGELVLIDPANTGAGEQRVKRDEVSPLVKDPNQPGEAPSTDAHSPASPANPKPTTSRMPYS